MSKNSIIPFLKDYLINFLTSPFLLDTNDSKSKALTLNNGEIIHISNQFNVSRIEEFINRVNAQSWNIRIEKL